MNFKIITNGIVYVAIISGFVLMAYVDTVRDDLHSIDKIETNNKEIKKSACTKSKLVKPKKVV